MRIIQINMQPHFGGGEVYTAFLCRALSTLGVQTRLLHHREAAFWNKLQLPADTELVAVADRQEIERALPPGRHWVLTHGGLPHGLDSIGQHLLTGIAHMPVQGRDPAQYRGLHKVFAVSRYVLDGLLAAGIAAWPEPLYGVANLQERGSATAVGLRQRSCYDWDRRKVRDRLLGYCEPLLEPLRTRPVFTKRAGLTLGIVSRLTPIKQFPLLFTKLAPVLARVPGVNLEIFGAGGYASVRDLRRALAPIRSRVRFWGHQADVATVYAQLDYLLSGLPEKEALGLNVIEAQACGTPVLAPVAPPFTETVVDGVTGFLYRDPRQDDGAEFSVLLNRLVSLPQALDPRQAADHLAKFSFDTFVERLRPVVDWARIHTPE